MWRAGSEIQRSRKQRGIEKGEKAASYFHGVGGATLTHCNDENIMIVCEIDNGKMSEVYVMFHH